MKKILAIVLSIVMTLALGLLVVGCNDPNNEDPNKGTGVTLSSAMSKFDFQKGITLKIDAKGSMSAEDDDGNKTAMPLSISGESKMGIVKSLFKMDNELDIVMGEGEEAIPFLNPRIYIRGNELYMGYAMAETETTYTKLDLSQKSGQDINGLLSELLPDVFGSGEQSSLFDIEFVKDGEGYKGDFDLMASAIKLIDKLSDIVKDLSADTTLGDIYTKLGGDDLVDKLVGDTKAKEVYAQNVKGVKDMANKLSDILPPEAMGIFESIPDDVDEMIEMLNDTLGTELPPIGDGKTADYLKDAIKKYENKTIVDMVCDITKQEKNDSIKEEIQTGIDSLKETFDSIVPQIKSILESNSLKFSFVADSNGDLISVKIELALSEETFQNLIGLIIGGGMPFAEQEANADPYMSFVFDLSIENGASDFVDETTLLVYEIPEGPTDEELAVAYAGTYKLVRFTETNVVDGETVSATYNIGDMYDEETEVIADKAVMMLQNEDGTLSYTFVYGFGAATFDGGEWEVYGGKVSFMSTGIFFTYQYHNIEFGEDGTLMFDLVDTNDTNHVINITLMLEQPIVE